MPVFSPLTWAHRRRAELKLAARITAAGMAAYVVAHSLNLPQGYWAVFTAVLVVQASIGGSYQAALDRLIGTLGGAIYGAAVASLVPHTSVVALGFALALSLAPLATLAAVNPSFRVAPITAIILLLGSAGAQEGPFVAALFRAVEVVLGGLVGLVVSLTLFPARAHSLVGESASRLAKLLAAMFVGLINALLDEPLDSEANWRRHNAVQAAFDKLEAAAAEANRERSILLADDDDPAPVPRTLRRVYHDFVLMSRVAATPLPRAVADRMRPALEEAAKAVPAFLEEAAKAVAHRQWPDGLEPAAVSGPLAACESVLAELQTIAGDDSARLVALGFAFNQLARNLSDLAERVRDFAVHSPLRGG